VDSREKWLYFSYTRAHPLSQTSGRRLLFYGQGLLDIKVEHGLKDERTVLSEERIELGIIQYPQRIMAK
jgi:hypothetical protein